MLFQSVLTVSVAHKARKKMSDDENKKVPPANNLRKDEPND